MVIQNIITEENIMKITFDNELFFDALAGSIIEFPSLRKDFEELYHSDRYRFYEHAKRSKRYSQYNMSGKSLDSEEAMRRVYGILLCGEDDESIREYVRGKLLNMNEKFPELVKNPTRAGVDAFIINETNSMRRNPDSNDAKGGPMYFLAYLLYSAYGTDCDDKAVSDYLSHTYKMILQLRKQKAYFSDRAAQALREKIVSLPVKSQAIIKQMKSGHDLLSFLCFNEADIRRDNTCSVGQLGWDLMEYYKLGRNEAQDLLTSIAIVRIASYLSAYAGVDLDGLCGSSGVTKDERNMIINLLAGMSRGSDLSQYVNVTNYMIGHIFMLLLNEIRSGREYYFKNNSETQRLELHSLENAVNEKELDIGRLRDELSEAVVQNEQKAEEIRLLTDELSKETKEAIKPYASEISELNSRIRELEKALDDERAKTPELNALREFAFESQSDYIPSETTVTLAELMRGRKVIVVGGHVNWRNKMKERYPNIAFLDGHNKTLNSSIFDNADVTLFNTSNMSHAVYEKAVCYLRDKKLRFNYLGRSKNQDLLEAEIISSLQEI
jgi:hypothetical protein